MLVWCVRNIFDFMSKPFTKSKKTYYVLYIYVYYFDSTGPERGKNIAALSAMAMGGFIP